MHYSDSVLVLVLPDFIHCCSFSEAVIRLALSALVGVAAVAVLVYDIRSTRSELNRTEETGYFYKTHGVKPDQNELSRRLRSDMFAEGH